MSIVKRFEQNKLGRDFVIGDVHGSFHLVEEALRDLNFDKTKDRMFSVGDLVDRGNNSLACLDYLKQPWFHAVRGNHEQMAIEFHKGNWGAASYIANGGEWFFKLTPEEQQVYVDAFNDMPFAFEIETEHGLVGIVHAEVPDNDWNSIHTKPLEEIEPVLTWSRRKVRARETDMVQNISRVIVGHTVLPDPIVLGNTWYIDTGAVFYDVLTIVRL